MRTRLVECRKCEEAKSSNEFYPRYATCKSCVSAHQKEYREGNCVKIRERKKRYREGNRATVRKRKKEYCKENSEKVAAQQKRWREKNREGHTEQQKEYYEENRERISAQHKEYYEENRMKIGEKQSKYQANNREKYRARSRLFYLSLTPEQRAERSLHRFSLTMADYEKMLETQEGKCALCGEELGDPPKGRKRHPVDHDHKGTDGKGRCPREDVRGVVHIHCNVFLGFVEKRPGILEKVRMYLNRNQ